MSFGKAKTIFQTKTNTKTLKTPAKPCTCACLFISLHPAKLKGAHLHDSQLHIAKGLQQLQTPSISDFDLNKKNAKLCYSWCLCFWLFSSTSQVEITKHNPQTYPNLSWTKKIRLPAAFRDCRFSSILQMARLRNGHMWLKTSRVFE